jgi:FixJ family two-component response regulator
LVITRSNSLLFELLREKRMLIDMLPGITGVRDRELEQELEQAGVTYLPKPFTPRDLFDAVRQAMQPFSLREKQLESVANAV